MDNLLLNKETIKLFSIIYGLKKLEDINLTEKVGVPDELKFSNLLKYGIEINDKSLFVKKFLKNLMNSLATNSVIRNILFYEIQQSVDSNTLIRLFDEISTFNTNDETFLLSNYINKFFSTKGVYFNNVLGTTSIDKYVINFIYNKIKPEINSDGSIKSMIDLFGLFGGFSIGYINYLKSINPNINWNAEIDKIYYFGFDDNMTKMSALEIFCSTNILPNTMENILYTNSLHHTFDRKFDLIFTDLSCLGISVTRNTKDKEETSLLIIMSLLAKNGVTACVIKNGTLFNSKYTVLRKMLITKFNVKEIISITSNHSEYSRNKRSIIIFDKIKEKTSEIKFSQLAIKMKLQLNNDKLNIERKNVIKKTCKLTSKYFNKFTLNVETILNNKTLSLNYKEYCLSTYELSKNYKNVELQELFTINKNTKKTKSNYNYVEFHDIEQNNIIRFSNINVDSLPFNAKNICNKDDILISCFRPKRSKLILTNYIKDLENYIFSSTLVKLSPKKLNYSHYVYGILYIIADSFENQLCSSSFILKFKPEALETVKIPFPVTEERLDYWENKLTEVMENFDQNLFKTVIENLQKEALPNYKNNNYDESNFDENGHENESEINSDEHESNSDDNGDNGDNDSQISENSKNSYKSQQSSIEQKKLSKKKPQIKPIDNSHINENNIEVSDDIELDNDIVVNVEGNITNHHTKIINKLKQKSGNILAS